MKTLKGGFGKLPIGRHRDENVLFALLNFSKKWIMPLYDCKPALKRFTVQFEERMPQPYLPPLTQNSESPPLVILFLSLSYTHVSVYFA